MILNPCTNFMLKVYHEAKINGKTHRYLLCQESQLFQPTKCLSLPLSIFAKMMDLLETDREFIIFRDVVVYTLLPMQNFCENQKICYKI